MISFEMMEGRIQSQELEIARLREMVAGITLVASHSLEGDFVLAIKEADLISAKNPGLAGLLEKFEINRNSQVEILKKRIELLRGSLGSIAVSYYDLRENLLMKAQQALKNDDKLREGE